MKWILLFLCWMLFAGCASVKSIVTDGHPNRTRIPIEIGATAQMMTGAYEDDDRDGWVVVPRGAGAFRGNNGVVVKDQKTIGRIEQQVSPFVFGNVLYGGVPGVLTDAISGGLWEPRYSWIYLSWK